MMNYTHTLVTLNNVKELNAEFSIINRRRVVGANSKIYYQLMNDIHIELSNGNIITIEKYFVWDLSSVPRFLWSILPPDGDFELSSLIHDYLYRNQIISRKFADKEMLIWSKATSGTLNKVSMRNFDNWIRYVAVRIFGFIVWNKHG